MKIEDILDNNLIQTQMNILSKEGVLENLAELLFKNGYISETEGFLKDVYVRESIGQTGIGNYIAIPHGKSKYVKKIGVAIGINKEEIPWETLDGKGVKGIILFAVGHDTEGANEHLKLLSLFARKLGNDEIVNRLLCSENTEEVMDSFLG